MLLAALIRRAAWHAYASRDRRGGAQLRPGTVEGAGDKGHQRIIVIRSPRLGCVLEVMRDILQAGGDGETIRIVSCIELPAFLSDKGRCPAGLAQRPEPEKCNVSD